MIWDIDVDNDVYMLVTATSLSQLGSKPVHKDTGG